MLSPQFTRYMKAASQGRILEDGTILPWDKNRAPTLQELQVLVGQHRQQKLQESLIARERNKTALDQVIAWRNGESNPFGAGEMAQSMQGGGTPRKVSVPKTKVNKPTLSKKAGDAHAFEPTSVTGQDRGEVVATSQPRRTTTTNLGYGIGAAVAAPLIARHPGDRIYDGPVQQQASSKQPTRQDQIMNEVVQVWSDTYGPSKTYESQKGLGRDMLEAFGFDKATLSGAKYYQLPDIMATVRRFFPKLSVGDLQTVKTHLWAQRTSEDGVDIFRVADTLAHLMKGDVGKIRESNRRNVINSAEYRGPRDIKKFEQAKGWGKVVEGLNVAGTATERMIDDNMKVVNSVTKPTARLIKEHFPTGILPPKLAEYMQKTQGLKAAYYTIQNLDPLLIPEGLAAVSERGAWKQVVPGMVDLAKRAAKGDPDAIAQLEGFGNSVAIGVLLGKVVPNLPKGAWSAQTLKAVQAARPVVMKGLTELSDAAMKAWHQGEIGVAALEMSKRSGMSVKDAHGILQRLDSEFNKFVSGERQIVLTRRPGQVVGSKPTGNQAPSMDRRKATGSAPTAVFDRDDGHGASLGSFGRRRKIGRSVGANQSPVQGTASGLSGEARLKYIKARNQGILDTQPNLTDFWNQWHNTKGGPPVVRTPAIKVSTSNINALKKYGIDLADHVRIYTNDFVRHVWKHHGPHKQASNTNEFPIGANDINQIPGITANPDAIHVENLPNIVTKIRYLKRIHGTYILVEELRSGKVLVPSTMKHFRTAPQNPNWWEW